MLAEEKIESAKFTTASGQKAQALCFFVHPRILALMSSSEEAAGSGDQNGTGICVLSGTVFGRKCGHLKNF